MPPAYVSPRSLSTTKSTTTGSTDGMDIYGSRSIDKSERMGSTIKTGSIHTARSVRDRMNKLKHSQHSPTGSFDITLSKTTSIGEKDATTHTGSANTYTKQQGYLSDELIRDTVGTSLQHSPPHPKDRYYNSFSRSTDVSGSTKYPASTIYNSSSMDRTFTGSNSRTATTTTDYSRRQHRRIGSDMTQMTHSTSSSYDRRAIPVAEEMSDTGSEGGFAEVEFNVPVGDFPSRGGRFTEAEAFIRDMDDSRSSRASRGREVFNRVGYNSSRSSYNSSSIDRTGLPPRGGSKSSRTLIRQQVDQPVRALNYNNTLTRYMYTIYVLHVL